jgi:hypothetical protein
MLKLNLGTQDREFHVLVSGVLWKVKPLTRSEEKALLKSHTSLKYKKGREVEEVDDDYFPARAKAVIQGFEGLADEQGDKIGHSPAVIDDLCENYPNLMLEVLSEAHSVYAERVEGLEKNFGSGAGGKAK